MKALLHTFNSFHRRRFSNVTLYECNKCKVKAGVDNFYLSRKYKFGIKTSWCKACHRQYDYELRRTKKGFLMGLLKSAKSNQNQRWDKRSKPRQKFQLSFQDLLDQYEAQNGKGFYSHIPLKLFPLCDWQGSLERLDRNKDYSIDNTVFVASEFNAGCQWSLEKVNQIPFLIKNQSSITGSDVKAARIKNGPVRPTKHRKSCFQNGNYYCHICLLWKPLQMFYQGHLTMCKACMNGRHAEYCNTLGGYIRKLKCTAASNSKRRISSPETRLDFSLTENDLFDLLEEQEFKCKYSGIPMVFRRFSDWMCSLERLDNSKGYIRENCVLICWEFNSSDRTLLAKSPVGGSAQWSREKFKYFYKTRFGMDV